MSSACFLLTPVFSAIWLMSSALLMVFIGKVKANILWPHDSFFSRLRQIWTGDSLGSSVYALGMHIWDNPRKRPPIGAPIAAFDYDETIGRGVLHWKFAPYLANLGVIPHPHEVEGIRQSFAHRQGRRQAYKNYEEQMIETVRALYADVGLSRTRLAEYAKDFVTNGALLEEQYAFTRALFEVLDELGYALVLISLGPLELVHAIAERMGFHHAIGNIIETDEAGIFTGRDGRLPVKDEDLKELVKMHGYSFEGSAAIGDTAGDLKMLNLVSTSIAFNPKPGFRQVLDMDPANASVVRVVERAEVVTFTQSAASAKNEQPLLVERRIEDVLPGLIAERIRPRLEGIGYYLL